MTEARGIGCALQRGKGKDGEVQVFGATTPELERMAGWLLERGVQSVALESTGVYWIPVHEVLEGRGLEVLLVDTSGVSPSARADQDGSTGLRVDPTAA